ncbi:MAG TPA: hypothetical protein VJ784_17130 [Pyrinomonadaceae bacterium]|nr:hypothetical protein [Pyrinomonadaceae bacterium]
MIWLITVETESDQNRAMIAERQQVVRRILVGGHDEVIIGPVSLRQIRRQEDVIDQ